MVVVLAQFTVALLSLQTKIASELSARGAPARVKPLERLQTATVILRPLLVARISASQELREVSSWLIAFHDIGPHMW